MKTFKNKNYTKRDYEATNIVACQSLEAPDNNWIECDESILSNIKPLSIVTLNGITIKYFGHL